MANRKSARKGRKVDKRGRSEPSAKHVRLHQWMMESDAWTSLDPFEARLLVELLSFHNGNNNGYLFLSVRMAAERCNMGKDKAAKCFKTLQERGFIRRRADEPEDYSLREANKWILTEFGFRGCAATKDFMHWKPSNPDERPQCRTPRPISGTEPPRSQTVEDHPSVISDNITPFPTDSCPSNRTQLLPSGQGQCGPGTSTSQMISKKME